MTKFMLLINMGNAAMEDGGDIAGALLRVADRIHYTERGIEKGVIQDRNGNEVGGWKLVEKE